MDQSARLDLGRSYPGGPFAELHVCRTMLEAAFNICLGRAFDFSGEEHKPAKHTRPLLHHMIAALEDQNENPMRTFPLPGTLNAAKIDREKHNDVIVDLLDLLDIRLDNSGRDLLAELCAAH